jgi:DNA-directed RNA polymerase specialized sigma24 family protein
MVETTLRVLLDSALVHEPPIGPVAEYSLRAQTRMMLLDALASLPPRARAVVVLRYWADLSVAQVADVLGCSLGNVTSHSADALDKLRAVLGEAMAESVPLGSLVGEQPEPGGTCDG